MEIGFRSILWFCAIFLAGGFLTVEAVSITSIGAVQFTDGLTMGVSADGTQVVGQSQIITGGLRGFLWNAVDGMVALPGMGTANDVSADGAIIVGQDDKDLS